MKTLALFGATGNTGRYFLPAALKRGWHVKAFLRTPSKVDDTEGLTKVKGDLTNKEQVIEFIRGADCVVCLAGVPRGAKKGGPLDGFMSRAMTFIVAGMKTHGVRRLLFQVGGFTLLRGKPPTPCFIGCCLRDCVLAVCLGEAVALKQNQICADFLQDNSADIDWTLSRPGMLQHGETKGPVFSVPGATETVMFVDLAEWELKLLDDDKTIHAAPFPGYKAPKDGGDRV